MESPFRYFYVFQLFHNILRYLRQSAYNLRLQSYFIAEPGWSHVLTLERFSRKIYMRWAGSLAHMYMIRGVAQLGRALRWGRRGRWFKSSRSDHVNRGLSQ